MKLNKQDVGCHADGALGHQHVRAVLADLVASYCKAPELVRALNGAESDDGSEDYEAIDLLNATACEPDVCFAFEDGDLMLRTCRESCLECGGIDGCYQSCPANL